MQCKISISLIKYSDNEDSRQQIWLQSIETLRSDSLQMRKAASFVIGCACIANASIFIPLLAAQLSDDSKTHIHIVSALNTYIHGTKLTSEHKEIAAYIWELFIMILNQVSMNDECVTIIATSLHRLTLCLPDIFQQKLLDMISSQEAKIRQCSAIVSKNLISSGLYNDSSVINACLILVGDNDVVK